MRDELFGSWVEKSKEDLNSSADWLSFRCRSLQRLIAAQTRVLRGKVATEDMMEQNFRVNLESDTKE